MFLSRSFVGTSTNTGVSHFRLQILHYFFLINRYLHLSVSHRGNSTVGWSGVGSGLSWLCSELLCSGVGLAWSYSGFGYSGFGVTLIWSWLWFELALGLELAPDLSWLWIWVGLWIWSWLCLFCLELALIWVGSVWVGSDLSWLLGLSWALDLELFLSSSWPWFGVGSGLSYLWFELFWFELALIWSWLRVRVGLIWSWLCSSWL